MQGVKTENNEMDRLDHLNSLSKKNKRKKNLIKKAHELALMANLKVTVIIKDTERNITQEFNSDADFTVENIYSHKMEN